MQIYSTESIRWDDCLKALVFGYEKKPRFACLKHQHSESKYILTLDYVSFCIHFAKCWHTHPDGGSVNSFMFSRMSLNSVLWWASMRSFIYIFWSMQEELNYVQTNCCYIIIDINKDSQCTKRYWTCYTDKNLNFKF